jgi:nucleoid DNA-binding protein
MLKGEPSGPGRTEMKLPGNTRIDMAARKFSSFPLTLPYGILKVKCRVVHRTISGDRPVTKKEIVKEISEQLGLTQLKTKEIVQKTFDAIVDTLLREKRIELRNFGVFEVKRRKARKARNPRTGERVDVEPKNVVTFKPGKEMEERVRKLDMVPELATAGITGANSNGV